MAGSSCENGQGARTMRPSNIRQGSNSILVIPANAICAQRRKVRKEIQIPVKKEARTTWMKDQIVIAADLPLRSWRASRETVFSGPAFDYE
jgi:hypothetical protein